jgi:hypothetical protein
VSVAVALAVGATVGALGATWFGAGVCVGALVGVAHATTISARIGKTKITNRFICSPH